MTSRTIFAVFTCAALAAACGGEPDGFGGLKPGAPNAAVEGTDSDGSHPTVVQVGAVGGNGGDVGGSLRTQQHDDGNYGGAAAAAATSRGGH
jgi:hypothetical protein